MSAVGDRIGGRYRLERRIASGGMGVVWEAADEVLRRTIAVKQLRLPAGASEAEAALAQQRAMREARIAARLHHPHAVPVFDVVEHDGAPHIVMQYVPSETLGTVLRRRTALPIGAVARVGAEVASALHAAHALGVVHRDVKPANILIARPGGEAVLTDFGISVAAGDAALTSTGQLTGTPAYLAPEVARGADSTPASDVFSLASALYAAVEGRPPFGEEGGAVAVLHRVASGSFDAPTRSGALGPLLLRMMASEPAERPTMAEAAAALAAVRDAVDDGAALDAVPASAVPPAPQDVPTVRQELGPTAVVPVAPPADGTTPATMRLGPSDEVAPPHRRRLGALPWLVGVAALLAVGLTGFAVAGGGGGPAPAATRSAAATPRASVASRPASTEPVSSASATPATTRRASSAPAASASTKAVSIAPQQPVGAAPGGGASNGGASNGGRPGTSKSSSGKDSPDAGGPAKAGPGEGGPGEGGPAGDGGGGPKKPKG